MKVEIAPETAPHVNCADVGDKLEEKAQEYLPVVWRKLFVVGL